MSNSYGGGSYSSTAYGAGGGNDGGGFVYGASQGGSQTGGKGFSDESLRPVTIKQIIEAQQAYPDAPFRIDDIEVTQVTFIGQIRSISPQTTNITFKVDDGTGMIEVKQWLDADKHDESNPGFVQDEYVRVWGRLKSFNNKRHVGAHVIKKVVDFNEVNYHLLEATYVHLFFTKGTLGGGPGGGNAGDDDSMFVDGGDGGYGGGAGGMGGGDKLRGISSKGRQVYNWLYNADGGNEGLNVSYISKGTGMSVQDVQQAAEELIAPGLIYTTIDDETFAILDT